MNPDRLSVVCVVILIAAAALFSGRSEPGIDQLCQQYAPAAACRRL